MNTIDFIKIAVCFLFSLFCNYTDYKQYRVRNWTVVSFTILGLVLNSVLFGTEGIKSALLGGATMFLLFPLFVLRMLGAGDVKMMISVGTFIGTPDSAYILCYSILGAGFLALLVMLFRKNMWARFQYFWNYLKISLLTKKIHDYSGEHSAKDGGKFRFTYGVTLGLLCWFIQKILK